MLVRLPAEVLGTRFVGDTCAFLVLRSVGDLETAFMSEGDLVPICLAGTTFLNMEFVAF